ncbi:hypothetical protein ERO13_A08G091300v2 [Gossypium hirsutum]|uniref:Zinc finger GRF-type domain-containing protein n=3 Tax=Gossypium TaxID=3633 RepID=A0A5D2Y6P9_GOSMU|nr:hypothetical protein ERO13_A08G091300v2 [Gossypium hirsutum]TYH05726.1 hypothetical protein ES288_A08G104600v1 [Gossypium darwinii]TYI14147.1 hypothetical protein ES332_A08G105200v1 [Gossypium tomentosum]TYJ22035.1 hypothetical protein E1A91_A08G102000v1 [Gossypium mustelinum]
MEEANVIPAYYCGFPGALRTSWFNDNSDIRFFGCKNYGVRRCCFFSWFDSPMSLPSRVVIVGLLRKIKTLDRERRKEWIIWIVSLVCCMFCVWIKK